MFAELTLDDFGKRILSLLYQYAIIPKIYFCLKIRMVCIFHMLRST